MSHGAHDEQVPVSELTQNHGEVISVHPRSSASSSILPGRDEAHPNAFGSMKPRHVTMVAIGGAINTGLMIASGDALTQSGPASLLVSYTIVGLLVYMVLCALGEVAAGGPVPSTVAGHAVRYCDPAFGWTLGWIYWLKYMVVTPNQLTAAALVISYWLSSELVNPGIWITAFLVIIVTANYLATPFFGEYEFLLSLFKIVVMLGLIVLSTVIAFGGGPDHDMKLFRYWKEPGAFHSEDPGLMGRIRSICRIMPSTTFAYVGSELIGMAILHTPDPRTTAATAIRLTFYRIFVFNIVCVTLLGMLIPYDSPSLPFARDALKPTAASVFVVAIQLAKVSILPGILNGCVLLFVLSSANFALHLATKTLYGMSQEKNAPAFLSHTDQKGIPVYALAICSMLASLAYLNISSDSKVLFGYFVNLVTMFGLLTWISILITHISFVRALKAEKVPDEALAFKATYGQYGSMVALVCCVMISFMRAFEIIDQASTSGKFDYISFITSYLGIPLYIGLVVGHKVLARYKSTDTTETVLRSDQGVEHEMTDNPRSTITVTEQPVERKKG